MPITKKYPLDDLIALKRSSVGERTRDHDRVRLLAGTTTRTSIGWRWQS
jgi:hypothetical protein